MHLRSELFNSQENFEAKFEEEEDQEEEEEAIGYGGGESILSLSPKRGYSRSVCYLLER